MTRSYHQVVLALRRWAGTDENPQADADLALEAQRALRDRRAMASTALAVLARGALVISSLIYIPLTVNYLGVERFGVFVALTSLTSILIFADLGLGNGLLNVLSDANGRQDRETAIRAVSSAFSMLIAVAAILGLGVIAVSPVLDWARVFRVTDPQTTTDIAATATTVLAIFLIALPLGVVDRARMAYQEGYINSAAAIAGTVVALIALLLAIQLNASLPILVLAVLGPPVLATAANGIRLFARDRPWLIPRLRNADSEVALSLARIGFLFLVLQVAVAIAFQSDILVAAIVIGPEASTIYAVTIRVFMLVPSLVGLYLITLWPAYTEALARRDHVWVRRTLGRSVAIAAGVTASASLIIFFASGEIIGALTGGSVQAPPMLLIGAALWAVISAAFNAVGVFLNAASILKLQVVIAVVMAITSVTASILFARAFGVSGIIWGTLLAYVACTAVPLSLYMRRAFARLGTEGSP